jgi:hypothetical protein
MRRSLTTLYTLLCLATAAIACGGGDTPVTPEPPGPPPVVPPSVPANITVSSGLDQEAAPGTPVPVAPSVTVTTASGAPVPSVTVTFAIDSGGGTVTNATATTNASGVASVGSWTMGAAEGPQVLRATAGTLAPVRIRALARYPTVVVATQTVGPTGGTLTVNQPGSPLNGATIAIPSGATAAALPIRLSITSTAGITLRDGAVPVGPALSVAPIAGRLDKPAILRMPAPTDTIGTYMLAAFDPATGSVAVLPPLPRTNSTLSAVLPALDASIVSRPPVAARSQTISTGGTRAAQTTPSEYLLLTVRIPEEVLTGPFDSQFRAQRDNWDFDRMPVAWLPFLAGSSEGSPDRRVLDPDFGILATSLWYFEHQKSGGPLYGRFRKQADQAKSNIAGIRWAALANREAPDVNAEVSAQWQEGLSSDPADMGRVAFRAIRAMHWSSYDRPVPVFLYSDFDDDADGMGVATRTLGDNVIELVIADNKETPYRLELTESGIRPFTVINRDGSSYEVRAVTVQMHRSVIEGPNIASHWPRVLAGTVGEAEGWPEPELHWEKAALDDSKPIILAEGLKHWWECPDCPGFIPPLPDLEEASRPLGFQTRRIIGGVMPQIPDEKRMLATMRWSSDSVASDTEPTTTGHVLYMPQAFVTIGACEGESERWTRPACDADVVVEERSGFLAGWLGWRTVQYAKVSLRPSPAILELSGASTESFALNPTQPLPSGTTYSWVLRTEAGRDSVATTVPTHTRDFDAGVEGTLLIMAHEAGTKRIIALDSVEVKGAAPYWIITSIQDADTLYDADFPPNGPFVDLLARPGSGLLMLETTPTGTQLSLRVRKSGVWTPADCCVFPPFNAALHHQLRLGVSPSVANAVGPFFADWRQSSWSQSTEDLGSGTMTGRFVDGTRTYNIEGQGTQVGPELALKLSVTRNGKLMTGFLSLTAWYEDAEDGEVDTPPEEYRFTFTATRIR